MVDIETLINLSVFPGLNECLVTTQACSHLNLGACAGFALANCDWLGRTIAFYQVFSGRGGWLWANGVSVPRKVTPGLPGWNFFAVEVIVFFPYTLTKGVRVEKDKIR